MNNAFYIGATGLKAQQSALETVSNNVANMNTVAFKRGTPSFIDLISASAPTAPRAAPTAFDGVVSNPMMQVFSQGELRQTSNPLDIAVRGSGFIELQGANGQVLLWRGGTLHVNEDGNLAVPSGETLKAALQVPAETASVAIGADGRVQAVSALGETSEIGQIELVTSTDTRLLKPLGAGIFEADESAALERSAAGEERAGTILQGYQESSNVQLADEMVNLLIYQRAFAASARVVQAGDELMGLINGLRR